MVVKMKKKITKKITKKKTKKEIKEEIIVNNESIGDVLPLTADKDNPVSDGREYSEVVEHE